MQVVQVVVRVVGQLRILPETHSRANGITQNDEDGLRLIEARLGPYLLGLICLLIQPANARSSGVPAARLSIVLIAST